MICSCFILRPALKEPFLKILFHFIAAIFVPAFLYFCDKLIKNILRWSQGCIKLPLTIELIDIEGQQREIIEAFWKSPYLNVMYCKDLKKGTWPHHFRKIKYIITRAENIIQPSEQHYIFSLLDYLILNKSPSVPDLYSITGTLSI